MKITIIGAGYVGLSLAMLLSSDNEVTIVDKDEKKIEMINDGVSPLRESDIIKAFAENKDSIIATSSIEEPLINADLIIIAVSTDFNNELNRFELHNVESIINVAYQVNTNATIVIKSTIPVGFTNEICHKYILLQLQAAAELLCIIGLMNKENLQTENEQESKHFLTILSSLANTPQ